MSPTEQANVGLVVSNLERMIADATAALPTAPHSEGEARNKELALKQIEQFQKILDNLRIKLNGGHNPAGTFLYAGEDNGTVAAFSIGADGSPTAATGVPSGSGPENCRDIGLSPDGKFLYIAGLNVGMNGGIAGFSVNGGTLTPVSGSPFISTDSVFGLAIDPSSKFAYAQDLNSDILGFGIQSGGTLQALSGSPFLTGGIFPQSMRAAAVQ